ncbi:MAG TPA: hypothetical protein VLY03_09055 [Bacteroidota bacterium]|nr:hypothetical protein [Bacteroidota bacterium]
MNHTQRRESNEQIEQDEYCHLCERMIATFEADEELCSLNELPNTFDKKSRMYVWKDHAFVSYALIPRSINGSTGLADLYVCVDEDDLDDIDLENYAAKLMGDEILPAWRKMKSVHLTEPTLAPPVDIRCKLHLSGYSPEIRKRKRVVRKKK